MPDVVKKGRSFDKFPVVLKINFRVMSDISPPQDFQHPLYEVEDAQRVRESRVFGPWVSEPTDAQLPNPSKALKLGRVNKIKDELILAINADQLMDRVSKDLPTGLDSHSIHTLSCAVHANESSV